MKSAFDKLKDSFRRDVCEKLGLDGEVEELHDSDDPDDEHQEFGCRIFGANGHCFGHAIVRFDGCWPEGDFRVGDGDGIFGKVPEIGEYLHLAPFHVETREILKSALMDY